MKLKKCRICKQVKKTKHKYCFKCHSKNFEYNIRNDNLIRIGFDSYKDYLQSDLWLNIKKKVLERDPECRLCGAASSTVHHQNYSKATLLGENKLTMLIGLCHNCHYKVEYDYGKKLTHYKAVAKYKKLRKIYKYKLKKRAENES